jgi:hypothetical protein
MTWMAATKMATVAYGRPSLNGDAGPGQGGRDVGGVHQGRRGAVLKQHIADDHTCREQTIYRE